MVHAQNKLENISNVSIVEHISKTHIHINKIFNTQKVMDVKSFHDACLPGGLNLVMMDPLMLPL